MTDEIPAAPTPEAAQQFSDYWPDPVDETAEVEAPLWPNEPGTEEEAEKIE